MPKKKLKVKLRQPFNNNGVLKQEFEPDFDAIVREVQKLAKPMVGTMSFRDLYDYMRNAAISAVGNELRDLVNSKPIVPKRRGSHPDPGWASSLNMTGRGRSVRRCLVPCALCPRARTRPGFGLAGHGTR